MPALYDPANPLDHPVGFSRGVFGHDLWETQEQILESVAVNRRTAVKSCHSSGKTFLAADAVLWWITKFPEGIAITTAPGWLQVEKLLWGEILSTVKSKETRIAYPTPNLTELKFSEKNYAIGISTKESNRFQGFKGKHVLLVLDEAQGVNPEVWAAIRALMASGVVHVLAIGNPTVTGGEFYEAFTTKRALWNTITISAFDTPNFADVYLEYEQADPVDPKRVVKVRHGSGTRNLLELTSEELDANPRPYLCSLRYAREMFEELGPDNAFFQARVLGEFSLQSESTLIPLSWIERAKLRPEEEVQPGTRKSPGEIVAGLDVAGPGEAETVLSVFDDGQLVFLKGWKQPDPRGEVIAALRPFQQRLKRLNIDSVGIGWGIYLAMKTEFGTAVVNPVNVGVPARDTKKFINLKAELFWRLRLMIQSRELTGIKDEKTVGQLTTIQYSHDPAGKIKIESKDELAKRGVASPDYAESVMLAQAPVAPSKRLFKMSSVQADEGDLGGEKEGLVSPSRWR